MCQIGLNYCEMLGKASRFVKVWLKWCPFRSHPNFEPMESPENSGFSQLRKDPLPPQISERLENKKPQKLF